ncbi:MAG TPA: hypothetical protein VIK08_03085 [Candidatus Limnocylindrales bacterium]
MPDRLVLGTLAGFALVVGSMALVWYVRRRRASSIDDPSILLAAPPEGMTPAVAAHVGGAPMRLSFMAALLDLASRGEITFVEESVSGEAAEVGIDIGGVDPSDPRIERNRRQPAGEAESWVLGQLELSVGHPRHAPWDSNALADTNFPLLIGASEAMLGAVLREADQKPEDQTSSSAVAQREKGLLSGGPPDAAAVETAYEARTGHPMPASAAQVVEQLTQLATPNQSAAPDQTAVSPKLHIGAKDARALTTPMLFGTFLDTYIQRHGWLGSLPVLTRLRWHIVGGVAVVLGIAVMSIGVDAFSDAQAGFGLGLFFGGLVAYWRAPVMVQPSVNGGRVRAQLAAYRRTLQMTFQQASSIRDAVGPTGLAWLSTPDQAIAWSVALGLAPDVAAVLARSAPRGDETDDEEPAWFKPGHGKKQVASPAQMFVGIENIGSTGAALPGFLRPMRSWWPS